MKKVLILILVCSSTILFSQNTIYVKDFNAIVDDQLDDTAQINAAIKTLTDGDTLVFEEGIYHLESLSSFGISHVDIRNTVNITLLGAQDSNGNPTTHFQRKLELFPENTRYSLLYCRNNKGLHVKNMTFDNTPHQASAGKIIEVDPAGKFLRVQVFEGLPMDDDTPFTAANVWEPTTLNLKEVPSLTFTTSPANMKIEDITNRIMKIESTDGLGFLQYVTEGEYLTWHYGWTANPMVNFREGENITIENIQVYNSLRSAIFIAYVKNVTVKNVRIAPKDGEQQLAVSPRDGIHSSRIKGHYLVENLFVTGTRLDAFVARGTFAELHEIIDNNSFVIKTDNILPSTFTYENELPLEFIDKNGERVSVQVSNVTYLENTSGTNTGSLFHIESTTTLPDFAEEGTSIVPKGFSTTSLTLKNNAYRNIAGSSEINYVENVISTNNTHFKIMYPAVRMGSNRSAGHSGSNYEISHSSFTDCTWVQSYDQQGYISSSNNHDRFGLADLSGIRITNNSFVSSNETTNSYAIQLSDVYDVHVTGNSFCGFLEPFTYNAASTRNIHQENNSYCSCSSIKKIKQNPIKDSFVKGGDYSATNYGGYSFMEVKNSSTPKFNRISYLQFDASSFLNRKVTEATLLLYIEELEGKNSEQNIYLFNDQSWEENAITFNNKPPEGLKLNSMAVSANSNQWYRVQLTTGIKDQLENQNGIISLAIIQDPDSETLLRIQSKESSYFRAPILEFKIELEDENNDGECDDNTLTSSSIQYKFFNQIRMFPNPVKNSSKLLINRRISSLKYEVYTIKGKLILKNETLTQIESNGVSSFVPLKLEYLESGVYFIIIYEPLQTHTIKFIKE